MKRTFGVVQPVPSQTTVRRPSRTRTHDQYRHSVSRHEANTTAVEVVERSGGAEWVTEG
jgi:hypothetical protein